MYTQFSIFNETVNQCNVCKVRTATNAWRHAIRKRAFRLHRV